MQADRPAPAIACPGCGCEVAWSLRACPSCHRLIHGERLKALAEAAQTAQDRGAATAALASWRDALELLPPESRQHAVIAEKIARLGREIDQNPAAVTAAAPAGDQADPHAPSSWSAGKATGALGAIAFAIWKFKFLVFVLLGKAKFLLLGLTKASTFLSMFAAAGVYWTVFGGWFALGLVLSIYVHEMGHVAALVRYGMKADAPLFVPGLGAFIRLRQTITDPRQDAWIGLAGPIWGLGAALACLALYAATGMPIFAAVARFGALVNLFNLIPIWQLDGGRAFHGLTRSHRWLATAAVATAWSVTEEGMLMIVMAVCTWRSAFDKSTAQPDRGILAAYAILVAALSAILCLPVPLP